MNKTQLIIMWIGIILIVLMGLFPPCTKSKFYYGEGAADFWFAADYSLIFALGSGEKVDFARLLIQCFIVALLTIGSIITFKEKDKKPKDEQKQ